MIITSQPEREYAEYPVKFYCRDEWGTRII